MKRMTKIMLTLLLAPLCLASCSTLLGVPQRATISEKPDLSGYRYVYIAPTPERTSITGSTYGNRYMTVGSTTTRGIVPSDVIANRFIKQGFIRVPEINETSPEQTLAVIYNEGDKRMYGMFGDYSIEVTIQLLTPLTYDLICTVTAEGMGNTEVDDITEAITKCLDAIFEE